MAAAFRSRLVAREPLYGAWSVIPSPLSVRLLAAAGLDYVVIDLQHGGATPGPEGSRRPTLMRVYRSPETRKPVSAAGLPSTALHQVAYARRRSLADSERGR